VVRSDSRFQSRPEPGPEARPRGYSVSFTYSRVQPASPLLIMTSLRQKHMAPQSLPRRQSAYPGMEASSHPLPPPPRVRPKDKSKVESLMKRRYSTRGPLPHAPQSEAFPAELSVKSRAADSGYTERVTPNFAAKFQRGRERPKVDQSSLASRGFNPEQFIASSLSGASEEEFQKFYDALKELQSSTSADLQSNVFNNYASFVSLSHEISSLTSDLSTLSSLLVKFSSLSQSLSTSIQKDDSDVDQPSGFQRERRGAQHHRNSLADLAQIHASHLQELWHLVEGSQKFLPAHPGRHVIKESLNWTELNPATWKPTKTVHLILLNDHLLVAAKKRSKTTASHPRKSVADRCWNLVDIEVGELVEDRQGTNAKSGALQVMKGREIAVYAAGEGRDKERVSFLKAFTLATSDLYNRRKHSEPSLNKGTSLFA
jgi:hypothetical protein